jgi:predicted metalloprotease with PDZ domain
LERGANANDLLTEKRTPLLYAVEVNAVDLIPELVKHGADINAPERKFGRTPLMCACREGASPQVVQALLDHGARIDLRQHIGHDAIIEGETALSMAYLSQRRELIDILLTRGAREGGFLGVVSYPSAVSADVRARLKLDAGAIVANVLRNSAADVAGIQRDDAIIELAGQPVTGDDDLIRILSSRLAGDKLRCLILRQGKHIEVPVELHPSCRAQRKYPEPERGFLGVVWYPPAVSADVQARLKLEAGAIIAKVEQDSAADIAGIQRDDAIIELAGEPVARNSDVVRILSSKSTGDRFSCVVVRQGERIEVPVELKQRQRRPHQIVLHVEWPSL